MRDFPDVARTTLKFASEQVMWAAVRHNREVSTTRMIRNDAPESCSTQVDEGAMVEVMIDGHFGYAATADLSEQGLRQAFHRAVDTTRACSSLKLHAFDLRQRPSSQGIFRSARQQDLDQLSLAELTDGLLLACAAMKGSDLLVNRMALAILVQTQIDYFSTNGTDLSQDFDMVALHLSATAAQGSESQTRSWGHVGQWGTEFLDRNVLRQEAERVAHQALALLVAPNCPSGPLDLILMPDQMMLQIHESIGHPLELDRILGDERNYAGWSFVKPEDFGRLRYGSELMNISFDPGRTNELASYAFDDAGLAAGKQLLIEGGILKRGLGALESQTRSGLPGVANFRSASWNRAPIDRMANINLEPGDASLEELIEQVEHGILMHTNRSWSIDDYRRKFQFGCEYAQLIDNGRLGAVVRNPNYRGVTVDFWSRLAGVGRQDEIHGSLNCGKGEPNQVIRVGHASPPCLFKGIEVFGGQS